MDFKTVDLIGLPLLDLLVSRALAQPGKGDKRLWDENGTAEPLHKAEISLWTHDFIGYILKGTSALKTR